MYSAYRRFMSWFDYSGPFAILTIGGVGGGLYGAYLSTNEKNDPPTTYESCRCHLIHERKRMNGKYLAITAGCAAGIIFGTVALPVLIITSPVVVPAYIYTKFNSTPEPDERTLCNRI